VIERGRVSFLGKAFAAGAVVFIYGCAASGDQKDWKTTGNGDGAPWDAITKMAAALGVDPTAVMFGKYGDVECEQPVREGDITLENPIIVQVAGVLAGRCVLAGPVDQPELRTTELVAACPGVPQQ
jgi:hypothetical protein